MNSHTHPTHSSATASAHAPASHPLELLEARRLRDLIATRYYLTNWTVGTATAACTAAGVAPTFTPN